MWEGGDGTGRNPTDRGKSGVKRHVLSDGRGVPVAVTVSAANVNDNRVAEQTLDSVLVKAGRGLRRPEHLCLDKGYDDRKVRAALKKRRIIGHIRRRGEVPLLGRVKGKPRRWVIERTHSWHTRFRSVLIRWETKVKNYQAIVHLASGLIAFQQAICNGYSMF